MKQTLRISALFVISISFLAAFLALRTARTIQNQAQESTSNWSMQMIHAIGGGADGISVADLEGDGDSDLVVPFEEGGIVRLYINNLNEGRGFTQVTVAQGLQGVEGAYFGDIDGDGLQDIIATMDRARSVHVYFAPQSRNFTSEWTGGAVSGLPPGLSWLTARAAQIDGIGQLDIAVSGTHEFGWLRTPANPRNLQEYSYTQIYKHNLGRMSTLIAEDVDLDGDSDVVAVIGGDQRTGDQAGWWENNGTGSQWTYREIGSPGRRAGIGWSDFVDLNGDSRKDLVTPRILPSGTEPYIVWFQQPQDPKSSWTQHEIRFNTPPSYPSTNSMKAVRMVDVNFDGRVEAIFNVAGPGGATYGDVYVASFPQLITDGIWNLQNITSRNQGKFDELITIDIDKDGDIDILTTIESEGVVWLRNDLTGTQITRSPQTLSPTLIAPTRPPLVSSPTPSPSTGPGSSQNVPASIASNCERDVSQEFNIWIKGIPDGSTVSFPQNACYLIESGLLVENKKQFIIEGNNAQIQAKTDGSRVDPAIVNGNTVRWPRNRTHLMLRGSSSIVVRNLIIRGSNPDPQYNPAFEAQHGININHSSNITLENLKVYNVYGDAVYVGEKAKQVILRGGEFIGAGRMGFGVTDGEDIVFEGFKIASIGRSAIDIEPHFDHVAIRRVTVQNGTFHAPIKNRIFANLGKGSAMEDIRWINNRVFGRNWSATMRGGPGKNRKNYTFINNTSDTRTNHPPVYNFTDIENFEVRGAYQLFGGQVLPDPAILVEGTSCGVVGSDNQFPGLVGPIHSENLRPCNVTAPTSAPTSPTRGPITTIGVPTIRAPTISMCDQSRGDANCDGRVDLIDFETWRQEFTRELRSARADFNNDQRVDLVDFETWRQEFAK